MVAQFEDAGEVRHAHTPVVALHMIPVLANEDFRHLLDDVAEWLHLGALAGDTDDRHRCVLEHDRHVDAVLRTLELVLAVDGHGLLRLDGEARALVRGANTRGIGARDDGARGIGTG